MELKKTQPEYAGIRRIGIPRALHYYRFGKLWLGYFGELGLECVVSEPTARDILEAGINRAIDESCYSAKIYLGHVNSLIGRCDAVFVPRIAGTELRKKYCTRFESLYDTVCSIFAGDDVKFITLSHGWKDSYSLSDAYIELGMKLGFTQKAAKRAWSEACRRNSQLHKAQQRERQALMKTDKTKILLAAHPYIAHDPYIGGRAREMLENLGCAVLYVDGANPPAAVKRSFGLSATMPWIESREILGTIDMLRDSIDGAVLMSAYPCSADSMANEFIMRAEKELPILQLTVDVQDGTAGLETRLESFVDIIRFRKEGRNVKEK